MTTQTAVPAISPEQYRGLQAPVVLPTPQEVFEFNVEILKGKGLLRYEQADAFRNRLPALGLFLVVPPRPAKIDDSYLGELMSLVELDGRRGANYLDSAYIENSERTPGGVYLLLNVEDGANRRSTMCSTSAANIKAEGRCAYTVLEGVFHTIVYPMVLTHHYLDLVGSRCAGDIWPFLDVVDGRPRLYFRGGYAYESYGAPSAGSRIGA